MLKEFRDFAMKGNVVDLAVGFIIGAAFSAIRFGGTTGAVCLASGPA